MTPLAVLALSGSLTVCAEPDNLPFSNERGEGFDNRVVSILAQELGVEVHYLWQAPRRRVRRALREAGCDIAPGIPAGFEGAHSSRPYYRSSYVFVRRADEGQPVHSIDDPRLAGLRIGLQLVGNGYAPPGQALSRRGLSSNLVGFSLAEPEPSRLLSAVARGEVDLAIVWGPIAGYFASKEEPPLVIEPVPQTGDLPFIYDISIAVWSDDPSLARRVDRALEARRLEIEAVLDEYGVPRLP